MLANCGQGVYHLRSCIEKLGGRVADGDTMGNMGEGTDSQEY